MKLTLIAGARPNFMKIAPIIHAVRKAKNGGMNINYRLVHTGQHYDAKMSDAFFEELKIPHPDVNLKCGGGTQSEQTASIMVAFEKELLLHPTDLVIVVGDVTSTMACTIVAKKLNTKVAHVEAGIRSGDMSMPEEVNRIVTDSLTDYFFTTTAGAGENLLKSGVSEKQIFFVGNVMIDTLLANMSNLIKPVIWDELGLIEREYFIVTLHRPSNVDQEYTLQSLLQELIHSSKNFPLIFPVHPRTKQKLQKLGIQHSRLHFLDPLSYLEFNFLVSKSKAVITDSGGITEETTVLGIPCMTLRENTERPETITEGTNELLGINPHAIKPAFDKLFSGNWKKGRIPELWDGKSSTRIVDVINRIFNKN